MSITRPLYDMGIQSGACLAVQEARSCRTCSFFSPLPKADRYGDGAPDHDGFCRFNPPGDEIYGGWPTVVRDDWCGKYLNAGRSK